MVMIDAFTLLLFIMLVGNNITSFILQCKISMRTVCLVFSLLITQLVGYGQNMQSTIQKAINSFEADDNMRYGIIAFEVVDSQTGKVVFSNNSNVGLPAASSQKVLTAITAFDLLGSNYTYKTDMAYTGTIDNGVLTGEVYLTFHGDPTLGSDRFAATKSSLVIKAITDQLLLLGIVDIKGKIILDGNSFPYQPMPGGWLWTDIGNYYGAGHWGINWHENQYDLILKPGQKEGDPVTIVSTDPPLQTAPFVNFLTTGKQGSGDNAYIYLAPYSNTPFVTGTVPAGTNRFTISGSFANPANQFMAALQTGLASAGIKGNVTSEVLDGSSAAVKRYVLPTPIYTWQSPALAIIIGQFLTKSVNLYGEALVKTIGRENGADGSTENGLSVLFQHLQTAGIDSNAIRMVDGSGLSPQNRITAHAFVQAMQYARKKSWFNTFYNALPVYNGIRMKSGTIGGVKSFTGYVKSAAGTNYTFAFVVNNFTGKSGPVVQRMYQVLNMLK